VEVDMLSKKGQQVAKGLVIMELEVKDGIHTISKT